MYMRTPDMYLIQKEQEDDIERHVEEIIPKDLKINERQKLTDSKRTMKSKQNKMCYSEIADNL